MLLRNEITDRLKDFKDLCMVHGVRELYAFGSAITDDFDPDRSDIDFLVEIDDPNPLERGEKLLSLWDTFESFFHRKVDLLTSDSLKNPYLKKIIDDTKILIYDGKSNQVFI